MNPQQLHALREYELARALVALRKLERLDGQEVGDKLLEIGAGTGIQAKLLSESGLKVNALDILGSHLAPHRTWNLETYDGKTIPFPDNAFDLVFNEQQKSSNTTLASCP